jgi:hypothetical protein
LEPCGSLPDPSSLPFGAAELLQFQFLLSLVPGYSRPIPCGMFGGEKISEIFQVFDPFTETGEFGSYFA